jgi:hypothetical protein
MRELIWQERREFLTPEQREVLGNLSPFTEFVIHTYLDQCDAPTIVEEIYHRVPIKRYTDKMIRERVRPQDPGLISTSDNTSEWTTEVRDGITVHQSKPNKDIWTS